MLIITSGFLLVFYNLSEQNALEIIQRSSEVGIGYLSDNTIQEHLYLTTDITIEEILLSFTPAEPYISISHGDDEGIALQYTFSGTAGESITLYRADFPQTFVSELYISTHRTFYYSHLTDNNEIVLVASLEKGGLEVLKTANDTIRYAMLLSPVIIILSIIFSALISRIAVAPLKKLVKATKAISYSNFNYHVKHHSDDEIGQLSSTFNDMANRLETAFVLQRRFVSDATHELKTPLASLKTALSLALKYPASMEDQQQMLLRLSRRVDTLQRLIGDLLLTASIEEERSQKTIFDLREVIIEVFNDFEPLFEEKGLRFSMKIEEPLYILAERRHIHRMISNLVDNASKNTPIDGQIYIEGFSQSTR
jgi:signal transduction histidine kinase